MNVTLCSHFRNATGYLRRYVMQVNELAQCLRMRGNRLDCIWAEGDSTDDTRERIQHEWVACETELFFADHGGKDYGSVVHPERFANLSKVCNAMWQRLPANADAVVWMESDLIWEPATVLALLDRLADFPAIAPMIMLRREGYPANTFYDTWAARKDGKHISTMHPYFPGWALASPTQVDSAGSCLVMRGDVARGVSWPAEDVIVGLCRQIREQGGSVWLDPNLEVVHL